MLDKTITTMPDLIFGMFHTVLDECVVQIDADLDYSLEITVNVGFNESLKRLLARHQLSFELMRAFQVAVGIWRNPQFDAALRFVQESGYEIGECEVFAAAAQMFRDSESRSQEG